MRNKYSPEFKIQCVKEVLENHLSQWEVTRKYELKTDNIVKYRKRQRAICYYNIHLISTTAHSIELFAKQIDLIIGFKHFGVFFPYFIFCKLSN